METYVLAVQARILMVVGLGWIVCGLWLGQDPATVAWRASAGALGAMWASGWLLRKVVAVLEERMAADMAERELAAQQKAQQEAPAAGKPVAGRPVPPVARPRPIPPERKGRAA
jgi:hypothetical protein